MVLENVKEMWTEFPRNSQGKKGRGVNKDRFISKMCVAILCLELRIQTDVLYLQVLERRFSHHGYPYLSGFLRNSGCDDYTMRTRPAAIDLVRTMRISSLGHLSRYQKEGHGWGTALSRSEPKCSGENATDSITTFLRGYGIPSP